MASVSKVIQEEGYIGSSSGKNNGVRIRIATKLILSFLLIIVMTSAIFTGVGIYIINDHIKADIREQVREDLDSAREIYQNRLRDVNSVIRSTADRTSIQGAVASGNVQQVADELVATRIWEALDMLTITDESGNVLFRASNPDFFGDNKSRYELIGTVLRSKMPAASTTIIAAEDLRRESPLLAEKVSVRFTDSPEARMWEETDGMMLGAAAPIVDSQDLLVGVVYGGVLLNSSFDVICELNRSVFHYPKYDGKDVGFVKIYQDGDRILTACPITFAGIGTSKDRTEEGLFDQTIQGGRSGLGRGLEENSWYVTAHEPIKNIDRETIGVLQVGELEQRYIDIKNQLVVAFLTITLLGALIAILFAYHISRGISVPLNKLVTASSNIARGDLEATVDVSSMTNDELSDLANAFNAMANALKERDERLKELTKSRIRRSERLALIGKLSADVAHELNNPLTGIVTYSHLLLERMPDQNPDLDYVNKIVVQANRCRDIIRGLLDFARQREPEKTLCDVNVVLQECISLLENQALFHNVQIIEDLNPRLPLAIIDPSQVERVFMNIIINAAEAMDGYGRLTIVSNADRSEKTIEITFSDTGHGISEEDQRRIFDPFFTTKEVGQGTGLGLAISYGIIREHGGTISVDSKVGKGSTFTIRLPVSTDLAESKADQDKSFVIRPPETEDERV